MIQINKIDFKEEEINDPCVGLIFKCKINSFINKKGEFVYKTTFVLQKRMSCPGCIKCSWFLEELSCGNMPLYENEIDGKYYTLEMTNVSTDWETGYLDDYDLEFIEMKVEENKDE